MTKREPVDVVVTGSTIEEDSITDAVIRSVLFSCKAN